MVPATKIPLDHYRPIMRHTNLQIDLRDGSKLKTKNYTILDDNSDLKQVILGKLRGELVLTSHPLGIGLQIDTLSSVQI